MSKKEIIRSFINTNSLVAKQGSKEWLQARNNIIGGSELSVLTGDNAFSTIQSLISQKVGISNFDGNTATRWGSLFEKYTELIFAEVFSVDKKVFHTGSIVNKNVPQHAYSPDGIALVLFNDKPIISLLEFKAPLRSIPDKKVPKHYLPQIKAGLDTIDIAEKGLFVNNMYRKCSLWDLNFEASYDTIFHKSTPDITKAIANGLLLFYIPKCKAKQYVEYHQQDEVELSDDEEEWKPQNIKKRILNLCTAETITRKDLIDFGTIDGRDVDDFFYMIKNDQEKIVYSKYLMPQINPDAFTNVDKNLIIPETLTPRINKKKYDYEKNIETFIANENFIPLGYMAWKLLKSSIIEVDKDPSYLKQYKDKINSTIDIINKINKHDDTDLKANEFEKYYPNSDTIRIYEMTKKRSKEFIDEMIGYSNSSVSDGI